LVEPLRCIENNKKESAKTKNKEEAQCRLEFLGTMWKLLKIEHNKRKSTKKI
jgi:hypothetical protein